MMVGPETFVTLLKDPAHWEFELFLMFLQDVILGLLILPLARKHWLRYHPAWKKKLWAETKTKGPEGETLVWINDGEYTGPHLNS